MIDEKYYKNLNNKSFHNDALTKKGGGKEKALLYYMWRKKEII